MVGSPTLRCECRPLSLPASQPTGVVRALYPRLNKITILVDIDKCLAIVEDQSGDLRQCQKKPTQTGDDGLCSSNHSLSWGKVREPIVFEEGLIEFLR